MVIRGLSCLVHLQVAAVRVWLDRRVVEHRDWDLGVRGLRAELVVGIAERLADRVDTDQSTRGQEVLALE